jgi:hypothetical protein
MSDTTDLQAIINAITSPTFVLRLDPGRTYVIEPGPNTTRGLYIPPSAAGLRIIGRGAAFSVVRGVPAAFNTIVVDAPGVVVCDLDLEGGVQPDGTGHRHGVFVSAPSVTLERVSASLHEGDGIVLYTGADDAQIRSCKARGNKRNGLTFNGATRHVTVQDSEFAANAAQQVDFEIGVGAPESAGVVDSTLLRCTMSPGPSQDYVLTLGDHGMNQRVLDCVINGGIKIVNGTDIEISRCRGDNETAKAIEITGASDKVRILDSQFSALVAKRAIWIAGGTGGVPGRIELNDLGLSVHDVGACAIEINGAADTVISQCQLQGAGVPVAGRGGVMIRSTLMDHPMETVKIDSTSFDSFGEAGIVVGGITAVDSAGVRHYSQLRRLVVSECDFGNNPGDASLTTAILADRTLLQLVIGPDITLEGGVTLGGVPSIGAGWATTTVVVPQP